MSKLNAMLQAHVDAAACEPVIGVDDCGPWAARWIQLRTGKSVALSYGTREEAYSIVARRGGLESYIDELLGPLGFDQTPEPKYGDIAITKIKEIERVGIVCGDANTLVVAVRGERLGVNFVPGKFITAAWSLDGSNGL